MADAATNDAGASGSEPHPAAPRPDDPFDAIRRMSEADDVVTRSKLFGWLDDLIAPWLINWQDAPILRRMLTLVAICCLGAYGNFAFSWDLADLFYLGLILNGNCLGVFLHMMSHRKIFRKEVEALNRLPIWLMSVWFGDPPYFFAAEHVANHHAYNNTPEDLSCTLAYQRDSLLDFGRYLLHFFFGEAGIIGHARMFLAGRGGRTWRRRFFVGQTLFWGFVALRLGQDWVPTSVLLIGPFALFNLFNRANNETCARMLA